MLRIKRKKKKKKKLTEALIFPRRHGLRIGMNFSFHCVWCRLFLLITSLISFVLIPVDWIFCSLIWYEFIPLSGWVVFVLLWFELSFSRFWVFFCVCVNESFIKIAHLSFLSIFLWCIFIYAYIIRKLCDLFIISPFVLFIALLVENPLNGTHLLVYVETASFVSS